MDELAQCYYVLPQLDINNTIDHRPEGDEKWFLENEKTVTQFCRKLAARSEERFSRNAETDLVCRLLLEKKNAPSSARAAPRGATTCRATAKIRTTRRPTAATPH